MPFKKIFFFTLLYLTSSSLIRSQTSLSTDSNKYQYTTSSQNNLSFSQQQVNDWKEGEKGVLDIKSSFRINSQVTSSWFVFTATVRANLGVTRDNSIDTLFVWYKTTDNDLLGEARISFPLGFTIDPFVCIGVKTQITESQRLFKNSIQRTANFWDPVTSDESLGFTYRYSLEKGFITLRSGVNLQQIRADESTTLTDDPKTQRVKELYKASAGMECMFESQYKIDSLVSYSGKWNARKNIITNDTWQFSLENEFRIKIWKYLGIVVIANVRYDESITKRVQFKQSTMFGLILDM